MDTISDPEAVLHENIEVVKDGDRFIHVIEYRNSPILNDNGKESRVFPQTGTLQVNSKVLLECSDYFKAMMRAPGREGSKTIIMEDDKIKSVEIWLRHFHGTLADIPVDSVSIKDVWYLIKTGNKYEFNLHALSSWFGTWFLHHSPTLSNSEGLDRSDEGLLSFARQVVFPCFAFNDAFGFTSTTNDLVYRTVGHITEANPDPENLSALHLPSRVISQSTARLLPQRDTGLMSMTEQLNAAKDRLRNFLPRCFFDQVKEIINSGSCECKENVIFYYLRELCRSGTWPMEGIAARSSIQTLIYAHEFNEEIMRENLSKASSSMTLCVQCDRSWTQIVADAEYKVDSFDGLCLDCMDKDKSIVIDKNDDDDYLFDHKDLDREYDIGCRVAHGKPTWYYSFMGRQEKRGLIAN